MAIDVNNSRFCLAAAKRGVSFRRTLTLGRLGLFAPPALLRDFFTEFGITPCGEPDFFEAASHPFCEGFFRQLGAEKVASLDFSDYEGATLVHDLNVPVPPGFEFEGFDAVVDGGTLEHVFNFPAAVGNAMSLVRPGGHLLLDLPANNCCGHGFYQFSPELFFRLLTPERGFSIERVLLAEDSPFSPWFEVRDPAEVRARATLTNAVPTHVFVLARRLEDFETAAPAGFPAQSDYTASWEAGGNSAKITPTVALQPTGFIEALRRFWRGADLRGYFRFSVRRNQRPLLLRSRLDNTQLYRRVDL